MAEVRKKRTYRRQDMAEITLEELRGKRQQETLAAQKAPETAERKWKSRS